MKTARNVRVLMLGWEYPPRMAGGLGKACQGLSQAMAKLGANIFFILPSFPERISSPHLEVAGARECLEEAGWENGKKIEIQSMSEVESESVPGMKYFKSEARLSPYGKHPRGPISQQLQGIFDDSSVRRRDQMGDQKRDKRRDQNEEIRAVRSETRKETGRESDEQLNKATPLSLDVSDIYGKNFWSEIEDYCFSLRHLVDSHEVDLIHAHDWMTFPAAFEFQRVSGAPVYLHVHATEYDRSGESLNSNVFGIERDSFRRANHIFTVSQYTADMIERLYGIHKKKISVVYNAPENEKVIRAKSKVRKPQVVFLGRLTFQKGPDHFLKAASIVAQINPKARFIICGTGDLLGHLKNQVIHLGIEEKTHFAGFVEPAGVEEILRASQVLVMPSVSEPFGLVALEALRCEIPVILSKQSGVREVLQRALQVDFWDHEKLADQILAALRLSDLSKQLVQEGTDQIKQLSWENSAQQVLDVYRRTLGSTFAQAIGGTHGH